MSIRWRNGSTCRSFTRLSRWECLHHLSSLGAGPIRACTYLLSLYFDSWWRTTRSGVSWLSLPQVEENQFQQVGSATRQFPCRIRMLWRILLRRMRLLQFSASWCSTRRARILMYSSSHRHSSVCPGSLPSRNLYNLLAQSCYYLLTLSINLWFPWGSGRLVLLRSSE